MRGGRCPHHAQSGRPRCRLNERIIKLLATGFGSGLAPLAPGTMGTLTGVPLYLLLDAFSWPNYFFAVLMMTGAAIYLSQAAEKLYAAQDPPCIVIDEIVGFLWTMLDVPPTFATLFLGFILFRFFDIAKPFPVRALQDKLPGGYGVVGDDVMAGIYSCLVLHLLMIFSLL